VGETGGEKGENAKKGEGKPVSSGEGGTLLGRKGKTQRPVIPGTGKSIKLGKIKGRVLEKGKTSRNEHNVILIAFRRNKKGIYGEKMQEQQSSDRLVSRSKGRGGARKRVMCGTQPAIPVALKHLKNCSRD